MMTAVPYNDAPWKRKAHLPECGLKIRHFTTCSRYHGGIETVWVVRCPVTDTVLAPCESEDKARLRARQIAVERDGVAA